MRPTRRFLYLLIVWGILGALASVWSLLSIHWQVYGIAFGVIAVGDGLFLWWRRVLRVERKIAPRLALGVDAEVVVTLYNDGSLEAIVEMFDGIPEASEANELPWQGQVPAKGYTAVTYPVRVFRRGSVVFTATQLLMESGLGLWKRKTVAGSEVEVKVFPNYEPVVRFALLAMDHRETQMGIIQKNRQGLSRDFHQLREYHEGDILSQIDWKASSRRLELISREYREQRDQNIILLLDCGRRMRAMDGELSQFDHCLNAMLLISYIALRQGDHVGIQSFGGVDRWLPPVKGSHSMTTILNHLYDFETTPVPSDFAEAAEKLMIRQRRRSLVILLTNLRSEDATQVVTPLRMIQRRHLVLLASLRERHIDERLKNPVNNFEDALEYGASHVYLEDRDQVFQQIRSFGINTLDESAHKLPISLTNKYLRIKASGRL